MTLRIVHSDTWGAESQQIPEPIQKAVDQSSQHKSDSEIDIDALYPAKDALSPQLRVALDALSEVTILTSSAIESLIEMDPIAADDKMQRVHARLYELFCQRELGDGFGAVINACICAFENIHGQPLSVAQIQAFDRVLRQTRDKPLMKYDAALALISILEAADLTVEPRGFEALTDWLSA